MTLGDKCLYWVSTDQQCYRSPVAADYVEVDPLKGERLVTSNCARHDGAAVRAAALAQRVERRERRPTLTVVPDESKVAHL